MPSKICGEKKASFYAVSIMLTRKINMTALISSKLTKCVCMVCKCEIIKKKTLM